MLRKVQANLYEHGTLFHRLPKDTLIIYSPQSMGCAVLILSTNEDEVIIVGTACKVLTVLNVTIICTERREEGGQTERNTCGFHLI